MRLTAKILKNVANVNQWQFANLAFVFEGQANDIYIQIADLSKTPAIDIEVSTTFPEFPLRYLSQASVLAVSLVFDAINDTEELDISGSQPFTDDKSIWKFSLTSSQLPKSGNMQLKIVEDGVTRTFLVINTIKVEPLNPGAC